MSEPRQPRGHAAKLNEPRPEICGQSHPLLEDLRCERLRGHPGKHAAVGEGSAAEFSLQWGEGRD